MEILVLGIIRNDLPGDPENDGQTVNTISTTQLQPKASVLLNAVHNPGLVHTETIPHKIFPLIMYLPIYVHWTSSPCIVHVDFPPVDKNLIHIFSVFQP